MPTEAQILDAMRHIIDPDLGKDIVSLGFIKHLVVDGGKVAFTVELTTPACPVKDQFKQQCEAAVAQLPGVASVAVTMGAMAPKERPGPKIDTLADVGAIIAVSSCKGGVGKSTVAALLARAIQREGHAVGLLDLDIYGPSMPTLMRTHHPQVRMRDKIIEPVVVDGLKTMSLGYVMGEQPAVMRGPMVAGYTTQVLQQTGWGRLDYLIIDLPPGTGDIQLTLVQQASLDGAIIVTTPQSLALVDVARGILMFEKVSVPVLGVVENMAWFECDGCAKRHHLFGGGTASLTDRFGLSVLARLPILPGLSEAATRDAGAAVPAFAQLADSLHREVGRRRMAGDDRPTVTPERGKILVEWADGTESRIHNKALRCSCQCALCVDEYTGAAMLDPGTVPDDIRVEAVQPLGNYAVAITWSDGHSSGIYSWSHLRRVAGL